MDGTGDTERTTVRDFIAELTATAAELPAGLDSPVELSVCNGEQDQYIDRVTVEYWQYLWSGQGARPDPVPQPYVLIRAHWHPGKSPGKLRKPPDLDKEWQDFSQRGGE